MKPVSELTYQMAVTEAININHCEAEICNDKYTTNIVSSFLQRLR